MTWQKFLKLTSHNRKTKTVIISKISFLISDIECGVNHTLFLSQNGKVYSCGWSADGQTGLGHYNNQHSPEIVLGDITCEKIIKVTCSADNVLALNGKNLKKNRVRQPNCTPPPIKWLK